MAESMGAIARETQPEGAVRRLAGDLRQINSELELERNRLSSIQARILGQHEVAKTNTVDSPPEPVRQDLEELQHQIGQYRELVIQINAIDNALIEL